MKTTESFQFIPIDNLVDADLELRLIRTIEHAPETGLVPEYDFTMDIQNGPKDIGGINIRIGHSESLIMYGGQIGYSVDEKYRGNKYATRSIKLVLPIFEKHGFKQVYVTCNPDNVASIKSIRNAGGEYIECVDVPPDEPAYQRGEMKKNRYVFKIGRCSNQAL